MTHHISRKDTRPLSARAHFALLSAAAALSFCLPPAVAAEAPGTRQEIRIILDQNDMADPRAIARIRRQIERAADRLCGSGGGLAAIYRNEARRCVDQVVAEAGLELRNMLATRFAARTDR